MKEYAFMILVVFALVAAAFSQTTNSKYEVTFFGARPRGQDVWNLPRSVAVDGKGSILIFRASQPPVLMVDPVTQQRAGGNAANNPDAPGGFIKQVIKKK